MHLTPCSKPARWGLGINVKRFLESSPPGLPTLAAHLCPHSSFPHIHHTLWVDPRETSRGALAESSHSSSRSPRSVSLHHASKSWPRKTLGGGHGTASPRRRSLPITPAPPGRGSARRAPHTGTAAAAATHRITDILHGRSKYHRRRAAAAPPPAGTRFVEYQLSPHAAALRFDNLYPLSATRLPVVFGTPRFIPRVHPTLPQREALTPGPHHVGTSPAPFTSRERRAVVVVQVAVARGRGSDRAKVSPVGTSRATLCARGESKSCAVRGPGQPEARRAAGGSSKESAARGEQGSGAGVERHPAAAAWGERPERFEPTQSASSKTPVFWELVRRW